MDTKIPAQPVIREEGTQKLYSFIGGILGAYCIVRAFSYFFPVYREIDFVFIMYVVVAVLVAVIGLKTGAVYAFGRSIHYSAFFLVYYLFIQRNEPNVLEQFKAIRNIALTGFVFLFVVSGLAIMATAQNKEAQKNTQSLMPSLVVGLLLVVFSYGIMMIFRDIFNLFGK